MMLMKLTSSLPHNFTKKYFSFIAYTMEQHGALQIGAVIALVADYLVWLDRTQIWVQNSLNKNGSNVADLYAALRRRMRTTAAGSHSTSPDQELHIYVGSVLSLRQFNVYILCLGACLAYCLNSVLNVKVMLVGVFNQEKAL